MSIIISVLKILCYIRKKNLKKFMAVEIAPSFLYRIRQRATAENSAEHQGDWVTRFLNRDTQICSQSLAPFCFKKTVSKPEVEQYYRV